MSGLQGGRGQPYTWLGAAYLLVVSALHWSRGGPQGVGAAGDLVAFYGAWYAAGLVLLGLGWWQAAARDRRA
jgi:hypothetical protein